MAHISRDKLSGNARSFKLKLESLGCPYTDGVEESWVLDLLFKPGEHRIRLLQWLFSKFDSRLHDLLDPQYVSIDSKMDSRIQRLLYVASSLGLCSQDDADLIRGAASMSRQSAFIEQLLDLVYIMDKSEDPQARSMGSPGLVGEGTDLSDQLTSDCWFIDCLAEQGNIDSVLMSDAKLLPPDITKQLAINSQERAQLGKPSEIAVPDSTDLDQLAADLLKELRKQEDVLEDLRKTHELPKHDAQSVENVQKTLRLVLSELSQLTIGFSYCFDNEVRQWCNKTAPQLSDLGLAFHRIHGLLQHFVQMLSGVGTIRTMHKNLCLHMPDKVRAIANEPQKGSSITSMLEDFQEHIAVLKDSLMRVEKTSPNRSTSISSTLLSDIPKLS